MTQQFLSCGYLPCLQCPSSSSPKNTEGDELEGINGYEFEALDARIEVRRTREFLVSIEDIGGYDESGGRQAEGDLAQSTTVSRRLGERRFHQHPVREVAVLRQQEFLYPVVLHAEGHRRSLPLLIREFIIFNVTAKSSTMTHDETSHRRRYRL